jgi:hypothetical protein
MKVVEKADPQNFMKEDFEMKSSPSQQNKPLSQGLFSIEVLPPSSLTELSKNAQTKNDSSVPSRNVYRRAIFKPISPQHLRSFSVGSPVTLPLFDGVVAQGHVVLNRAASAGEPAAISGKIEAPFVGSFAIVEDPALGLMGFVLPEQGETAYEIESDNGGDAYLDEIPKGELVCSPYPAHRSFRPAARVALSSKTRSAGTQAAVPILRSRANAKGVLYLDFDGAVVTDPFWASGATINALPSGLSSEKITDMALKQHDFTTHGNLLTLWTRHLDEESNGKRLWKSTQLAVIGSLYLSAQLDDVNDIWGSPQQFITLHNDCIKTWSCSELRSSFAIESGATNACVLYAHSR